MSDACKPSSIGLLIGRILLSAIFILSGIGKLVDYEGTIRYMEAANLFLIPLLLVIAALIEIFGGLSILLGYKTRYGALLLFLYLIFVTVIFHNFWALEGMSQQMQMIHFMKNLAIMGGLLYAASVGAGKLGLDSLCSSCCGSSCSKPKTSV